MDFLRVYFRGEKLGFITGTLPARWGVRAVLFITQDGGLTWESIDPGVRSYLTGIWMINNQTGFMVGANNAYLQTSDGGKTWKGKVERVAAGETRQNLWDVSFSSPTEGWIVGSYGSIQHTTDGGQNWEDQNSGIDNNLKAIYLRQSNNRLDCWTRRRNSSYKRRRRYMDKAKNKFLQ